MEPCFSSVTWLGYATLLSRGIHDVFLKNSFFKIAILYDRIIIESEKNEKLLLLKYRKNNKKTFMKKYNFGKAAVISTKINFTEQVLLTFSFLKCNNFSRRRRTNCFWLEKGSGNEAVYVHDLEQHSTPWNNRDFIQARLFQWKTGLFLSIRIYVLYIVQYTK